jgi:hypothetical protein
MLLKLLLFIQNVSWLSVTLAVLIAATIISALFASASIQTVIALGLSAVAVSIFSTKN